MKFKLNSKAMREILRSEKMRVELARYAGRGAATAGPGAEVDSEIGPDRARAAVIGQASRMDGVLDAMRGA